MNIEKFFETSYRLPYTFTTKELGLRANTKGDVTVSVDGYSRITVPLDTLAEMVFKLQSEVHAGNACPVCSAIPGQVVMVRR